MFPRIQENVPLAPYTTFRLGGPARYFLDAHSVEDVVEGINFARAKEVPILPLGAGSDILIGDRGFNGLVIRLVALRGMNVERNQVLLKTGEALPKVARILADRGLSGFEYLAGIPGTIGGGVAKNAGAHGKEIGDMLVEAYVVGEDGYIRTLPKEELNLDYRTSALPELGILLEAKFRLSEDDPHLIRGRMERFLAYREEHQPWRERTAGCMFKNPPGHYAGKLIEEAGLKGFRIGGVKVSEKHANFFVNEGGTADDAVRLIEYVRDRVYKVFGIELEVEIEILK
ncbi:MAG: UDP-N-acetylmuramate dehydrogenase [Thermotogae bacterium]|nr:UDP-N-acetylmuramate dehydrogenase [Thermotogota bacterium]